MNKHITTVTLNPAMDHTISIDRLTVGGLNRVQHSRFDPGGKGINVAKVLKSFGLSVKVTGFMAGETGKQIEKHLYHNGIFTEFVTIQGEMRTNLKIIDEQSKVTTEINDAGFSVEASDVDRFIAKFTTLLDHTSVLVLGGSIPAGVPQRIYQTMIRLANQKQVKTVLDAEGEALKLGIEASPYAIKPNRYELEGLMGKTLTNEQDVLNAGKACMDQGVSLVVTSLGDEGAIFMDSSQTYRVKPFPIVPQSTVGAGDSMVASLVHTLLQDKSLHEIARWATTAGTITASKSGTQVCTLQEVEANMERVHVWKM